MQSAVRGVIATLMLLGLLSAAALPKTASPKTIVTAVNGNPMPTCYPEDPGCKPPIPPK